MSELGDVLKRARLEKNLSLDEIQEQTKIRKRYLEALEEGDYEALPGKFYVRAFIKNYADAIGLDAQEVLNYYENDIPKLNDKSEEVIPARKPQRMRSTASEKTSKIIINILLWGFFILIISVLWYYLSNTYNPEAAKVDETKLTQDAQAPQTNDEPVVTPTPTPTPEVEVTPTTLTFVEKSGKDEIYTIAPVADSYTLSVVADGDSWVEIYDGGKGGDRLYYATMKTNESKTVTINKGAYIVVGRPGYVKLTLDETNIDLGNGIEPKRLILKDN